MILKLKEWNDLEWVHLEVMGLFGILCERVWNGQKV
jgi:hypothetical protein